MGSPGSLAPPSIRLAPAVSLLAAIFMIVCGELHAQSPPSFDSDSRTRTVPENTAADTDIGDPFTATDPDEGDTVTYSLGGTDQSSFTLDTNDGQLKTKAALDYESKRDYTVAVKATDKGSLSATKTVTISVTDLNDVAPEFANSSETRDVDENTGSGTAFGAAFSVTDPDTVGILTYRLEGTDAASFGFDASTRKLKTSAALNYEETKKQYSVTLRVSDGVNAEDTVTVTIDVNDVNEAPTFPPSTPASLSVDENTATNTEFGAAVAATDQDGDTLTYSIGGTDGSSFGINTSTGRLKTNAALDHESKTSYTVTVTATDTAIATATTTVAINVADVDEPPNAPTSPTVSAQTSSRIAVGWTAPANSGRPAVTGYKLSWTTSRSNPVTPTPATPLSLVASVRSTTVTGLDPATTYTFRVLATNDEGDGAAASVNGTTGANRPPAPGNASPVFSIAENSAAAENVGTVSATDPETDSAGNNRPVTYEMKSGDTGAFNLNTSTGQLTTKEYDYNYEVDDEYELTVAANDVHGGSADIAVTVNLTDVGGEVPAAPDPPALEREGSRVTVTYSEPANPGPEITGYAVQYRTTGTGTVGSWLSSGCSDDQNRIPLLPDDSFSCIDLDAEEEYEFQVRAKNDDGNGGWSSSAKTDNQLPVFSDSLSTKTWSVTENSGSGVDVGDPVTATDPDGGSISYTLQKLFPEHPEPPFTIGTSGQLATVEGGSFNHEAHTQTQLFYVVAKDEDGGIARFRMRVQVVDVAEPPDGKPGTPTLTALSGGRLRVTWTAPTHDSTQKPPITGYDVQYRNPPVTGTWQNWTHTGTGRRATITGLTAGTEYQVQVRAKNDEGTGPWSDPAKATAVGNRVPTFDENPPVTRTLAENTPAGRDVGDPVTATDADAGARLLYSLRGADADSFTISPRNGQIRTKAGVTYNFEAKPAYQVTVRVTDDADGHADLAVTINLTDVEEALTAPGRPSFPAVTGSTLTAEWDPPEDTGVAVTGYEVKYRNVISNTEANAPHTGTDPNVVISGLVPEDSYKVRVRAKHGARRSPWSDTSDEITLPDTTITFTQTSPISLTLAENADDDVALTTVSATIEKYALRVIGFRLDGPDAGAFELIGPSIAPGRPPYGSARLTTTDGGYNFEDQPSHSVTVVAESGNARASLVVNITITDDDTEAPSAPQRPSVQPESVTSLAVEWPEPDNGGPPITTYNLRFKTQGGPTWTPRNNLGTVLKTTIPNLTQGTTYEVQVQAVNDEGTGDWSRSGTGAPGNPGPNVLPEFGESPPVTRQVDENSPAGVDVGGPVTATDEGTITYDLEGADRTAFTIDRANGQISTTGAGYDHEAKSSYAVTVTATDDRGGVSRLDVTIEVRDLPEAPNEPGSLAVTAASPISLHVVWTAPADNTGRPPIARYQVQYRTPPETGSWQEWGHAGTALSTTITELESGTLYEVQVRAINDDGPGDAQLPGPWVTGTGDTDTNQPPSFTAGTSTSRTLAENPDVGVAIGDPVTATDPDGHEITYTLEGTDEESFSIDDGGVLRTVATEVYDFEAKPSYSLDVVATDEFGAAARIALTVTLEDVPESLSVGAASADETASSVVFTVTRVDRVGSSQRVTWNTEDGTATAGQDYVAASGTLTFAANQAERTLAVALIDDAVSEGPETFTVLLRDPVTDALVRALGTIEDNDREPALSIADAAVAEGAGTVTLAVTLSAARENLDVVVSWATSDGSAAAGSDYVAASGTLTFAPGETERTIVVTIFDDAENESDETFTVTLSDPAGATLATAAAVGMIEDDDTADTGNTGDTGDTVVPGEVPEVTVSFGRDRLRVTEGASAAVTVRLNRDPQRDGVTIPIVVTAGTATPGEDYTVAKPTRVVFDRGETVKTIVVRALADGRDEDDETFELSFGRLPSRVTLGSPSTTEVTVKDLRTLPPGAQVWLARFGRTAAGRVVDAVADRLSGPLTSPRLTMGGQEIELSHAGEGPAPVADAMPGIVGTASRGLTAFDLLTGSAFQVASGGDDTGGPGFAAWGRVSVGGFDAEEQHASGKVGVDGTVTAGIVGADLSWHRLLAGVGVSLSHGDGTFDHADLRSGTVQSLLVGVHPYARLTLHERLQIWALLGYGRGELTMTQPANADVPEVTTRADLQMLLAAVGARGALLQAGESGGFGLAVNTDAFLTRTESMKTETLAESVADASRVRLALDSSYTFALGERAALTPALGLGVHHDFADLATLPDFEVGGRIAFAHAGVGLSLEAAARAVIGHRASGFDEWGFEELGLDEWGIAEWGASGAARFAPGASGRGLSLRLAPSWGAASSRVAGLSSLPDTRLRPTNEGAEPDGRLDAEIGYGLAVGDGLYTGTPYAGLGLSGSARDFRVGWRFVSVQQAPVDFQLGIEGTRRETAGDHAPAEHGVGLRGSVRW